MARLVQEPFMPHKSLTHKDLSRHLGVSETTIKSYRRKFPGCIPVASQGKPIRFNSEALAVCKRIRDLFDLGLSIAEVHARLAGEFPWITPPEACPQPAFEENTYTAADAAGPEILPAPPAENADGEPRPDLPLIVSNLAKSVISLSRQQSALFKRLDSLEAKMDSALGRAGESSDGQTASAADQPAPVPAPESDAQLADKLDGIERTLEQTMRLLGNYVEAVQGLVQPAPEVSPLPPPKEASNNVPKISEEYLRHLATLPLVHKNEHNNTLAHLGDRSRGVYTLNDLKAVFAQACQPPEHYTAYWHVEKSQTWFVLEQPENPHGRALFLHIKLVRDGRGAEAAQITNMVIDGQEEHPAILYKTIQDMLG